MHQDDGPQQLPSDTQRCNIATNAGTHCTGYRNDVLLLSALHATRCYPDASLMPDNGATTRSAGLGVFIINRGALSSTTVYVQARINDIQSVLMAEAAAICLVAKLAKQLSLKNYHV